VSISCVIFQGGTSGDDEADLSSSDSNGSTVLSNAFKTQKPPPAPRSNKSDLRGNLEVQIPRKCCDYLNNNDFIYSLSMLGKQHLMIKYVNVYETTISQ